MPLLRLILNVSLLYLSDSSRHCSSLWHQEPSHSRTQEVSTDLNVSKNELIVVHLIVYTCSQLCTGLLWPCVLLPEGFCLSMDRSVL